MFKENKLKRPYYLLIEEVETVPLEERERSKKEAHFLPWPKHTTGWERA
jgi:hypothetical protein